MSQPEIENALLRALYATWFTQERRLLDEKLRAIVGGDDKTWNRTLQDLIQKKLIRAVSNDTSEITPNGITHVEKNGIAPEDLKARIVKARDEIIEQLAQTYDEKGPSGEVSVEDLTRDLGLEAGLVLNTLQFLNELDFVKSLGYAGMFRIKPKGLDYSNTWRKRRSLADDFNSLSTFEPHDRGRTFQKWFARYVEQEAWIPEEGVKTPGEENDVTIHRGREYYLIECKWEDIEKPVGAPVIRDLHGKIHNRPGMNGIVVSMSGFSEPAKSKVLEFATEKAILLFGPDDVNRLVNSTVSFDQLLNEKHGALLTRKKVAWS